MRKTIAITHVTLDGIMQAPGGPDEDPRGGFTQGGWAMPFFDEAAGAALAPWAPHLRNLRGVLALCRRPSPNHAPNPAPSFAASVGLYRNIPLSNAHQHAQEAAGAPGKFWEMHDVIYENQEALEVEDFAQYAATLDLDLDVQRLINQLQTGVFAPRVKEDFTAGGRAELTRAKMEQLCEDLFGGLCLRCS